LDVTATGFTLPRAVVALIAIVLVAWFGVLARDERIGNAAVDRIVAEPGMSRAAWNDAMLDLRRADLLDPATDWRVTRASYLLLRDEQEALRVARSVVRDEPDNLPAWVMIGRVATRTDPALAARAAREIERLNPSQGRVR
jgi:hypothetical protein